MPTSAIASNTLSRTVTAILAPVLDRNPVPLETGGIGAAPELSAVEDETAEAETGS